MRHADGRGADRPRRASVRSRRGHDPRRAARLRRCARRLRSLRARASAKACCAPSTAASSRPGPAGRPRAGSPTCCRPGATSPPSTRAPSRPAPPPARRARRGRGACAAICRMRATGRAAIVMDLWASPTLRSGGEDIAHALALMGVRPTWDHASTRVTGFEIMPLPLLDRPRIDVTLRVSGAFRDTFPDQIALLDQAARAVAALDEDDAWNALAAARRRGEPLPRVFGAAPGTYGAGVADAGARRRVGRRGAISAAPISQARPTPSAQAARRSADPCVSRSASREADAFVHVTDVAERDLLDGDCGGRRHRRIRGSGRRLLGRRPPSTASTPAVRTRPKARTLPRISTASCADAWPTRAGSPASCATAGAARPSSRKASMRSSSSPRPRDAVTDAQLRRRLRRAHRRRGACARRLLRRQSRPPARPSATASPMRAGAASGRAAATPSRRTLGEPACEGGRRMMRARRQRCGAAGARRRSPDADRRRPARAHSSVAGVLTADAGARRRRGCPALRQRPSRRHRPRQPADPRREGRDLSRRCVALLERAGLVEPEGEGPNRLTIVSPLAGLDPDRPHRRAARWPKPSRRGPAISTDCPRNLSSPSMAAGPDAARCHRARDLRLVAHRTRRASLLAIGAAQGPALDRHDDRPAAPPRAVRPSLRALRSMRLGAERRRGGCAILSPPIVAELAALGRASPRLYRPSDVAAAPACRLVPDTATRQAVLLAPALRPLQRERSWIRPRSWSEHFGPGRNPPVAFTRGILLPGIARRACLDAACGSPPCRASSSTQTIPALRVDRLPRAGRTAEAP